MDAIIHPEMSAAAEKALMPETLGDRVKALRNGKGWSQQRLAEEITGRGFQIGQSGIGNIEARGDVDALCIVQLAAALDVRPEYLQTGVGLYRDVTSVRAGYPGAIDLMWLAEQLERPGFSQAGLAGALGRDPASVSRILKGERQIKANEIPMILGYLKLEHGRTLLDEVRNPEEPTARETRQSKKLSQMEVMTAVVHYMLAAIVAIEDADVDLSRDERECAIEYFTWEALKKSREIQEAFSK
jgi:transcriptional regulator with XRE-family HTH domain